MKFPFKIMLLVSIAVCGYAADSQNTAGDEIVTPNVYKPHQVLPGCDAKSLAANLTRVCNDMYDPSGNEKKVDWYSQSLSKAICSGDQPIVGQRTTYSVLGGVQPCAGNHSGMMSSHWVCQVEIDEDYHVSAAQEGVYFVTCAG